VLRWKQFIEIYEQPNDQVLLRSLSLGYIINFYIPFRIGDIIRAFYSGRKMKNGISFSIATIIVDRYLDVLAVGTIFLIFLLSGMNTLTVIDSAKFYTILSFALVFISTVSIKYSKYPKLIMKKFSQIFNSRIELKILKLTWFFISVFKDIYIRLNRKKLLLNTLLMWLFYLSSYYLFAIYINNQGFNIKLIDIFNLLFSKNNLDMSMLYISNYTINFSILMGTYIMSPIIILLVLSLIQNNNKIFNNKPTNYKFRYLNLLPHANEQDKLVFLETYFSGQNSDYLKKYLSINRNISILQDYSAGSSATTMLCTDGDQTFFRKYAFGDSGEKLYDQVKWLTSYKSTIKLTKILNEKHEKDYCYYDMPYYKNAVSLFNYVHSTPIKQSWSLLEEILDTLDEKLHTINVTPAEKEAIQKYINSKVLSNIDKIEKSKEIRQLLKYDKLIINGVSYKNLNFFKKYLNYNYLYEIFKDDIYAELHGDLTIENIICVQKNNKHDDYYIIDPNTGNVHNSPNLDYAKLLQSLHGGYEFLMHTSSVEVHDNHINYIHTKSLIYEKLFKRYKSYLEKKFTVQKVKSIFFHEIIHWLRLMPYKIEKDEKRAVLFYAGLIIVLNEVGGMYEEKE
jgi:hypothetical protein